MPGVYRKWDNKPRNPMPAPAWNTAPKDTVIGDAGRVVPGAGTGMSTDKVMCVRVCTCVCVCGGGVCVCVYMCVFLKLPPVAQSGRHRHHSMLLSLTLLSGDQ